MPGIQKKDETLDNGSQPVKLFKEWITNEL